MRHDLLKTLILEQQAISVTQDDISRELPIPIEQLIQTTNIVILTGVRRCGKSTLLQMLRTQHKQHNYYLNFDDERLIHFTVDDFQLLMELFTELFDAQKICFFDEIQNISGWERFVRRLHDQGYKLFITGSNAHMLSQELGTHLTGRHLQLSLYPFSFSEYLAFTKTTINFKLITTAAKGQLNKTLQNYLKLGGFPQYIKEPLIEYLQSLYENILYRDIVTRYKLPSPVAIKQLAFYLASNVGKTISFNGLKKLLALSNANTVAEYCLYLENAYLFFLVKRFSYSLKSQAHAPKKVYAIDTGLASAIGFRGSEDSGRMLENLVFLALKRKNYDVFYHQDKKECDFVVCKQNKIIMLLQVCTHLETADTKEREIAGLKEAMLAYHINTGTIITLNTFDDMTVETLDKTFKIKVVPIWDFMIHI